MSLKNSEETFRDLLERADLSVKDFCVLTRESKSTVTQWFYGSRRQGMGSPSAHAYLKLWMSLEPKAQKELLIKLLAA